MGITKFNKSELLFKDTENFDTFKSLEELFNEDGSDAKHLVRGVYSYNSSYGKGCFIKSDGFNITLPTHLVDTINSIREDKESVNEIKNLVNNIHSLHDFKRINIKGQLFNL